jgi:hypothetical protein
MVRDGCLIVYYHSRCTCSGVCVARSTVIVKYVSCVFVAAHVLYCPYGMRQRVAREGVAVNTEGARAQKPANFTIFKRWTCRGGGGNSRKGGFIVYAICGSLYYNNLRGGSGLYGFQKRLPCR